MKSQERRMYLYVLKTVLKNEQYFISSQQKLFAFFRGFIDSESCSVAWDTNLFVASRSQ